MVGRLLVEIAGGLLLTTPMIFTGNPAESWITMPTVLSAKRSPAASSSRTATLPHSCSSKPKDRPATGVLSEDRSHSRVSHVAYNSMSRSWENGGWDLKDRHVG